MKQNNVKMVFIGLVIFAVGFVVGGQLGPKYSLSVSKAFYSEDGGDLMDAGDSGNTQDNYELVIECKSGAVFSPISISDWTADQARAAGGRYCSDHGGWENVRAFKNWSMYAQYNS